MFTNNYSHSKCPKCERTQFEVAVETPLHSNFKLQFVRCSSCKTAIGVLEYLNNAALLHKLAEKLNIRLDL